MNIRKIIEKNPQPLKVLRETSNNELNYVKNLPQKENDFLIRTLNIHSSGFNFVVKSRYSYKTPHYWIEIFKSEYEKIKPTTAKEYDVKRNKKYPTWRTTATMVNLNRWSELLKHCDLTYYNKTKVYERKKVCERINVRRKFDIDELK